MAEMAHVESRHEEPDVLHSLLHVAVNLASIDDLPKMLDMILREVRKLAQAEAGSLYVVQKGALRLAVAQNDRIASAQLNSLLVGRGFPINNDSLAGFVASSREVTNIPNSYMLPEGAPFRINREHDANLGYRVRSILAIPLTCPGTDCIGVLELFNRLDENGKVVPFPDPECGGMLSLVSMAAVTIHNALLRERLKQAHLDTIIRLSVAAEFRDNETAMHLRRISHTSALIAEEMGLTPRQVEVIRFASPMHDVGKIGIPDAILRKPGRLDERERAIIEEHPLIGTEILGDPMNDLVDAARAVALTHHERWDGKGYPSGLAGEQIPAVGRIVGLADVFDALVSKRCYKEAMSTEQALVTIRSEEGKHFDPAAVKAFFEVSDKVLQFYSDPANHDHADAGA